jgi:M6 family metalloprotease-like protein
MKLGSSLLIIILFNIPVQSVFPQKLLQKKSFGTLQKKTASGTVKVLALRVQFQKEIPDKPQTTGDGHFDLSDTRAVRKIDPAPHNKNYFEDQLLAMKNYFLDVSDGKLNIDYTVKPDGDTAAYTLGKLMEYYGIRGTQEARDKRLAEFFSDAVSVADQSGTIQFSDYDYVIVFHAGAGEDFSLENSTTADITSRFVSLDLLKLRFGNSYPGVLVDGNSKYVTGGVVVPETESQFFINPIFGTEDFREIGLSGLLIANFGSQLGMPDLFNTETGNSGIGIFGLEDQGAVNGDGLIPAEPDPWTKIYMGWAEPAIVTDSFDVHLPSRKLAGQNTILKIPINASEYFLVENRQRNVIDNSLSPEIISRFDTSNNSDGTITIDTVYLAGVTRSGTTKVITHVDEYDNGLPGNGLLIWHIDENIIRANIGINSINNDPERRGVRVVEGSGSQDIGYGFSGFFGVSVGSGDKFDYFYKGNEGFSYYNNKVDSVFFTPNSVPNTLSNDRAQTGIYITQISPIQNVMTFSARTSLLQKGFPQFAGNAVGSNSLKFGDLFGDSKKEIVAAGSDGKIYAWTFTGGKIIANNVSSVFNALGKDSTNYPVALFSVANDSILHTPALADLDNDGKMEVIAGTKNGKIYAWKHVDTDVNGFADSLFMYPTGEIISTPPLVNSQKKIVLGCKSGKIIVLNSAGTLAGSATLSGEVLGVALLSSDSVIAITSGGIYLLNTNTYLFTQASSVSSGSPASIVTGDVLQNGIRTAIVVNGNEMRAYGQTLEGFPVLLPETIVSKPTLADIDGDGYLEILFAGDNKIYAYNHNGTLATNFPITIDRLNPIGVISSSALVADLNDDNKTDVLVGTPNGNIYAYDSDGRLLQGFPLAAGQPVVSTPMLLDIDNDGDIEIATTSDDGFVYVWDLSTSYDPSKIKWGQFAHDAQNSSMSTEQNVLNPVTGDLIPKNSAYNYPNPARGNSTTIRYFLTEPAKVKIRIFDLAGDLVQTLNGNGTPQTDNEVVWDLKKIQSGVYLAKITAQSTVSGKKSTRTVKIAVTK